MLLGALPGSKCMELDSQERPEDLKHKSFAHSRVALKTLAEELLVVAEERLLTSSHPHSSRAVGTSAVKYTQNVNGE